MQQIKLTKKDIDKFMKIVEKYNKENEALLKKHKLQSRVVISFPGKSKVPMLGKFAMWILNKSGAIIDTEFAVKNNK